MTRPSPRYFFLAVAMLLVGVLAVGSLTESGGSAAPGSPGTSIPVQAAALVCPGLSATAAVGQATLLTAASARQDSPAPTAPNAAADSLRIDLLGAPISQKPLAAATSGTRVVRYALPAGAARTFVVRATGTLAQGLSAQFLTRTPTGPSRSLAAGQCSAPGGDFWFVGGGAAVGGTTVLLLSNIDLAAATVDVTVYGAKGPVNAEPGQGLLIRPGKQLALPLDLLSPGEASVAVHVVARAGRFAASMNDTKANGLVPGGTDWIPQSAPAATSVVVPAIGADSTSASTLSLLAPGPNDAVVRVGVSTASGVLVPEGFDSLAIPAGQLFTMDLTALASNGPLGLLIDSDQPLVAGVRTTRGGGALLPDFAYSTGRPPVTSKLNLSAVAATAGTLSTLQLTAGRDADASAVVTIVPATGTPASPLTVAVPAGRTVVVKLTVGLTTPGMVLVVPSPGSGPLYAALSTNQKGPRGPLISTWLFVGTPLSVLLPAVVPDPRLASDR